VDREKGSCLSEVLRSLLLISPHRDSSASAGAVGFDGVSPLEVHRITANLSTLILSRITSSYSIISLFGN